MICFINENKIKKFIKDKLKSINIEASFTEYLESYWLKKNPREYNYSLFIEKYKNNINAIENYI